MKRKQLTLDTIARSSINKRKENGKSNANELFYEGRKMKKIPCPLQ
jgi:hypothetical protein